MKKIQKITKQLMSKLASKISNDPYVTKAVHEKSFPQDFSEDYIETFLAAQPYTMTSPERIFALIQAVEYVVKNNINGDIVECGVWKGGSMLAVARTLSKLGEKSRHLYLCDTFEGMTEPTEKDIDFNGNYASNLLERSSREDQTSIWCYSPIESVKGIMQSSGYALEKIHFVKGKVEDTIPEQAPDTIAILRLDTDWYESTKHELVYLFPRLSVGGVIIIDDYGYWQGSRLATEEYIRQNNVKILLNRIDETGRIGIKLY